MRRSFYYIFLLISLFHLSAKTLIAEYYSDRPNISGVKVKDHREKQDLPEIWKTASHGHFVLLAQTLTFFPDGEYYFLARDIEYLYDMAQVLLKNNVALKKRVHLVPISSNLVGNNVDMLDYLEQEGVTKRNCRAARQCLLIPVALVRCLIKSVMFLKQKGSRH